MHKSENNSVYFSRTTNIRPIKHSKSDHQATSSATHTVASCNKGI